MTTGGGANGKPKSTADAGPGESAPLLINVQKTRAYSAAADGPNVPLTPAEEEAAVEQLELKRQLTTEHSTERGGILVTSWNLTQDLLTNSLVVLPYLFSEVGDATAAAVIMFALAAVADFTLLLERDLILNHELSSYYEMVHRACGATGFLIANTMSFIFNLGGYVGTLLIMSTLLPALLTTFGVPAGVVASGWFSPLAIKTFVAVVVSPLAFNEHISSFALLAFVSTGAIAFMAISVIARSFVVAAGAGAVSVAHAALPDASHSVELISILFVSGGLLFQFTCHDVFGHIVHSLERPTRERVGAVVHLSITVALVLCTTLGICGFHLYGKSTPASVLDALPTDAVATLVRLAMCINSLISAPYTLFISRAALLAVVQSVKPELLLRNVESTPERLASVASRVRTPPLGGSKDNSQRRALTYRIATAFLLVFGLVFSEVVQDLGVVISIIGGISGISIALILPPLCFLRLEPTAPLWRRTVCWIVLGVGCVLAAGSIVASIKH